MRDQQIQQIQDARVRRIVEQLELNGFSIVPRELLDHLKREADVGVECERVPALITLERVMQELIDEVVDASVVPVFEKLSVELHKPTMLGSGEFEGV